MTKNSVCIVIPKIIKVEHICKVIVKKEGCNFYGPQCITEKYVMQILWVIQVSWLQWLLVMIGMSLSGAVWLWPWFLLSRMIRNRLKFNTLSYFGNIAGVWLKYICATVSVKVVVYCNNFLCIFMHHFPLIHICKFLTAMYFLKA